MDEPSSDVSTRHRFDRSGNPGGEHYLVGEERRLHLKMELPTGPVDLYASPVRYESLEEDPEETGYVIGVRMWSIEEADRTRSTSTSERFYQSWVAVNSGKA